MTNDIKAYCIIELRYKLSIVIILLIDIFLMLYIPLENSPSKSVVDLCLNVNVMSQNGGNKLKALQVMEGSK